MLGPVGNGLSLWSRRKRISKGFAILKGALGWFSTQNQTVVTRTSSPLVPGAVNQLTVLTGQPDPWGGTTAVAYQSATTTAAHWARWDTTGIAAGEEWTVVVYLKPNSTNPISNRTRFFLNSTNCGVDFYTNRPTSETYAVFTGGTGHIRTDLSEVKDSGGWWRCEMTFISDGTQAHYICLQGNSTVAGTGQIDLWITPPVFTRAEVSAMINLAEGAATASQPTIALRPYVRSNWGSLKSLAFDSKACAMPVTAVPSAFSGAGTAFSIGVVIEPVIPSAARGTMPTEGSIFRLSGLTASLELRATSPGIVILKWTSGTYTNCVASDIGKIVKNGTTKARLISFDNSAKEWRVYCPSSNVWTNTMTNITDGLDNETGTGKVTGVAPTVTERLLTLRMTDDLGLSTIAILPVKLLSTKYVLYVVRSGGNIQLYCQGIALGNPQPIGSANATFTTCEIGGTTLSANLTECVFHSTALSQEEVKDASSYLAKRVGFSTAPIPLYRGRSQSNGLENLQISDLPVELQKPSAFSIYRCKASSDSVFYTHEWGPVRPRISDGVATVTNRAYSSNALAGATYAWGMTQQLGRIAIAHFGRGGTEIAEFLATGSLWAEGLAWDQSVTADLILGGIPYYEAGLVLFFGENDSTDVARANAYTGKSEQLRTDLETALNITIPVIVQPRVSNLLDPVAFPQSPLLRTNQVNWQAIDPMRRILVDIDNLPMKPDNVHLASESSLEAGKRIGKRSPRAA